MKKIMIIIATLLCMFSCSREKTPKVLVLYYSQTGNTEAVAQAIQNKMECDIEQIIPEIPYDGDFAATIERSKKEMDEGKFPAIKPLTSDITSYDIIFIGFPVWFGTYTPPVETLLTSFDFSGKKIVPFCTFGSGGLETSERAIKEKLPNSEILPGYGVRAARLEAVPEEIERFLIEGKFIEGECTPLEDFSEMQPASEEEASIFDAAVKDYPMIHAKAEDVSSRNLPNGKEYLFAAKDSSAFGDNAVQFRMIKIYVLAEEGKEPTFTRVVRN